MKFAQDVRDYAATLNDANQGWRRCWKNSGRWDRGVCRGGRGEGEQPSLMRTTIRTDESFSTLSSLEEFPETAALLGHLTVAWSHAERTLYFLFWVASGTTQQKAFDIYETIASFRHRYDLALDLFREERQDHPKMPELIASLQTLIQCFSVRNELVHRTWVKASTGELGLLDHRMSKKTAQVRVIRNEEIRDTIKRINGTCDKILSTILEIYPHAFKQEQNS